MTLQDREKKALVVLGVVLVLVLIYWLVSSPSSSGAKVVAAVENVDHAQKQLALLRSSLATLDGKQALSKQVAAELAEREKGLIPGDTADQAQAQLLQIIRRVARNQAPPLDIRQSELGQPRPYGDAYGEVTVSVTMEARIDELVNLLAALSAQPEIIATGEVRCGTANAKSKAMSVRLTVSGLVPRRLVPDKKGLSSTQRGAEF